MLQTQPASLADEAFLAEVYASVRRAEVAGWGWDQPQQDQFLQMQFQMQSRAYALQFPGADQRIILCDGQRAGRLMIWRTEAQIRLVDIALLPQWRGAGIGTRVLQQLQQEAAETHRPLCLRVRKENPACHLYKRLGFAVTGEDELDLTMEWRPHAQIRKGDSYGSVHR